LAYETQACTEPEWEQMLSAVPGGMWSGTRCPPSHTITPPPQLDGKIKAKKGLMGQDKDRQITQQLPSWAKQTRLGEIYFISYQSSQSKVKRNKNQSKKHLPLTPSFYLGSASLPGSLLPSPKQCRGTGSGVAVSSAHVVSAAPSSSGGGLLTLFPTPA